MYDERPLPENQNIEKLLLGSVLTDGEAFPVISEVLESADFSLRGHQMIFESCSELYRDGVAINYQSLYHVMRGKDQHRSFDSLLSYLAALSEGMPVIVDLPSWCRIIKGHSVNRQVIRHCAALMDDCFAGTAQEAELERIREIMAQTQKRAKERAALHVVDDCGGWNAFLGPRRIGSLKLPFHQIQNTLDGLRPREMTILGARTGIGKTAMAFQIAEYAAEQCAENETVIYASFEMGAEQLLQRAVCRRAKVNPYDWRRGTMQDWERDQAHDALTHLVGLGKRLLFTDDPAMTVQGLDSRIRQLSASNRQIRLVVVDYLQLMNGNERLDRLQQVSAISRGLKQITLRYGTHVLALSQLNMRAEIITTEPHLGNLKESGQIEQDADQVILLWPSTEEPYAEVRGIKWKIPKNRNGGINHGELDFFSKYTEFREVA